MMESRLREINVHAQPLMVETARLLDLANKTAVLVIIFSCLAICVALGLQNADRAFKIQQLVDQENVSYG